MSSNDTAKCAICAICCVYQRRIQKIQKGSLVSYIDASGLLTENSTLKIIKKFTEKRGRLSLGLPLNRLMYKSISGLQLAIDLIFST